MKFFLSLIVLFMFFSSDVAESENVCSLKNGMNLMSFRLGMARPELKTPSYQEVLYEGRASFSYDQTFTFGGYLGLDLNINSKISSNISNKIANNFNSRAYLGYSFSEIMPRWNFIPRVGVHYSAIGEYGRNDKRRFFPMFSPMWLYQKKSDNIFFMNMKYLHFDKGNFTKVDNQKHSEYSVGVELGEIVALTRERDLGFIYSLELERAKYYVLTDDFSEETSMMGMIGLVF